MMGATIGAEPPPSHAFGAGASLPRTRRRVSQRRSIDDLPPPLAGEGWGGLSIQYRPPSLLWSQLTMFCGTSLRTTRFGALLEAPAGRL
jgi:hypothetical protein